MMITFTFYWWLAFATVMLVCGNGSTDDSASDDQNNTANNGENRFGYFPSNVIPSYPIYVPGPVAPVIVGAGNYQPAFYSPYDNIAVQQIHQGQEQLQQQQQHQLHKPQNFYDDEAFDATSPSCGTRESTVAEIPEIGHGIPNSGLDLSLSEQSKNEGFETRIVGGRGTVITRWPWQISIRMFGAMHICGGSLIDNRHIVTAAHCFGQTKDTRTYTVHLGKTNKETSETGEQVRNVSRIIIHKSYNKIRYDSDIAMIRLEKPVQFTNRIRPICLPDPGEAVVYNKLFFVTGYGETKGTGSEDTLKEAAVPTIEGDRCKELSPTFKRILTNNMLCGGALEGGTDACQGDSGGPLIFEKTPGRFTLHGIVSFGISCAAPNKPGVYTRVTNFVPWINGVVKYWNAKVSRAQLSPSDDS